MNNEVNKKLIEDWFPIELVGEEGRQEKTSATGRIASMHQWHARRPTCAMRAIILESLIDLPDNIEESNIIKNFIVQYCQRFIPQRNINIY